MASCTICSTGSEKACTALDQAVGDYEHGRGAKPLIFCTTRQSTYPGLATARLSGLQANVS
jgi:hypothetical protein